MSGQQLVRWTWTVFGAHTDGQPDQRSRPLPDMLTAVTSDGETTGQESDSLVNSTEPVAEDLVVADQSQTLVNTSSANNCSNSTNDTNNNQISSNDTHLDTSSTTNVGHITVNDNSEETDDNIDDHRLDNGNSETVITECDNTTNGKHIFAMIVRYCHQTNCRCDHVLRARLWSGDGWPDLPGAVRLGQCLPLSRS